MLKKKFHLPLEPCPQLYEPGPYNSVLKFDIFCLLETYIDSDILPDDSNLEIPEYNVVRSDHLSHKKREGVCIIIIIIITNSLFLVDKFTKCK